MRPTAGVLRFSEACSLEELYSSPIKMISRKKKLNCNQSNGFGKKTKIVFKNNTHGIPTILTSYSVEQTHQPEIFSAKKATDCTVPHPSSHEVKRLVFSIFSCFPVKLNVTFLRQYFLRNKCTYCSRPA